eukprot:1519768-Amphidinium_carterae.1
MSTADSLAILLATFSAPRRGFGKCSNLDVGDALCGQPPLHSVHGHERWQGTPEMSSAEHQISADDDSQRPQKRSNSRAAHRFVLFFSLRIIVPDVQQGAAAAYVTWDRTHQVT